MKIMTAEELRAVDPEEFEKNDVAVKLLFDDEYTGKVLYDYDMGLSILEKGNTENCLVGINGPSYKGNSNYTNPEQYNDALSAAIYLLRSGSWNGQDFYANLNPVVQPSWARQGAMGFAVCSFT